MKIRAIAPVVLVAGSLGLAGCGGQVIIPSGAEKSIRDIVKSHTGLTAQNVKCPSDVPAKVGGKFQCHFNLADGSKYIADMRITSVQGSKVIFFIRTHVVK